jgi:hypothetical protein
MLLLRGGFGGGRGWAYAHPQLLKIPFVMVKKKKNCPYYALSQLRLCPLPSCLSHIMPLNKLKFEKNKNKNVILLVSASVAGNPSKEDDDEQFFSTKRCVLLS